MIRFDPHIPLALWLPLAIAAAALLVVYAIRSQDRLTGTRRTKVLGLMTVCLVLPLLLLLNPIWIQRTPPPPGKPLLTVLVDQSASMGTVDGNGLGYSRIDVARHAAKAIQEQLGEKYELRFRAFSETSHSFEPSTIDQLEADGGETNFAASIEKVLGEDRPPGQAVLVLSDGIDTSSTNTIALQKTAQRANALSTPLFVRPLGTQQGVRDLQVSLPQSQQLAFSNQRVPITLRLAHSFPETQKVSVTLKADSETIEERVVNLLPHTPAEETFYVEPDASGLFRYQLSAASIDGEVTELNNSATVLLRVIDQPVAVLLLEGKPYWDTKFLIRTLANDPSVALTSVVQMAPGRFLQRQLEPAKRAEEGSTSESESVDKATSVPQNEWKIHREAPDVLADGEFLSQFQIIILGRNTEAYLNDKTLRQLKSWVSSSEGSLVCFRGSPASQLTQELGAFDADRLG
ncbi:vWA domain-containing protein [Bremerella cremea]|uniref:vWA domain-containing protein n=1 Tax=Bremerella cremea TaxID=1031537 RepID=UPI0031E70FCE